MSKWPGCPTVSCKNDLCDTQCQRLIPNTPEFKLLERVALKSSELLDSNANGDKTVGQWRKEMSALITEVTFYVADRKRRAEP